MLLLFFCVFFFCLRWIMKIRPAEMYMLRTRLYQPKCLNIFFKPFLPLLCKMTLLFWWCHCLMTSGNIYKWTCHVGNVDVKGKFMNIFVNSFATIRNIVHVGPCMILWFLVTWTFTLESGISYLHSLQVMYICNIIWEILLYISIDKGPCQQHCNIVILIHNVYVIFFPVFCKIVQNTCA